MTQQTDTTLDRIGRWMAGRLQHTVSGYEPYTPSDPETLRALLRPGDVLLVEGNQYISKVIKYLTMSTWSHSAIFVGPIVAAVALHVGSQAAINGDRAPAPGRSGQYRRGAARV